MTAREKAHAIAEGLCAARMGGGHGWTCDAITAALEEVERSAWDEAKTLVSNRECAAGAGCDCDDAIAKEAHARAAVGSRKETGRG